MRHLKGGWAVGASLIAALASLFHLYLAKFGMLEALQMRASHLTFFLPLAFLLYPAREGSPQHRFTLVEMGCA